MPPPNLQTSLHSTYYGGRSLSKWNIQFDGSPSGIHIKRFLVRVEHMAQSENISEKRLVNELHYVLRNAAVEWYWTMIERNPNISWSALKNEIRKRFQDRRSDLDIRLQIESRKQRARDSFYEFYHDLISLSLQLETQLTDAELMRIIRRNMRPGLQDRLTEIEFTNVDDMVRRCVAHEDTWNRTGYIPELLCQPRRHVSELHEFPFSSSADIEGEVLAIRSGSNFQTNSQRTTATAGSSPKVHCWNCLQPHHLYPDCNMPISEKFCFGCGNKGYIKPHCPNCRQKAGNLFMGAGTKSFSPNLNKVMVDSVCNTDPEFHEILRRPNQAK